MRQISMSILWVTVLAVAGPPAHAQSQCQNVRGTINAQLRDPTENCPVATVAGDVFDESGNLIGTTTACITNLQQAGEGAIHVDLTHWYTVNGVTFGTVDRGVLSPVGPLLYHFNNRLSIATGASGFLRGHGTVNFETGAVNLRYHGRICSE
ncbi:MAG TPA: hypothetical protein VNI83_10285 [Vicinamibacterales bacterium]|nr:hypothetical protein [Vicinamibacterales bacterium]